MIKIINHYYVRTGHDEFLFKEYSQETNASNINISKLHCTSWKNSRIKISVLTFQVCYPNISLRKGLHSAWIW